MAKEIKAKNFQTDKEIEDYINDIAKDCKHFKVGKTGETVQDRGNQPDYQEYDNIQSLFASSSSEFISTLEMKYINRFKDHPKNDNDKDGRQSLFDNMADSEEYHLYIVWK